MLGVIVFDRYYDEMRQQLASAFGLKASPDKPATREELAKLDEKVKLEKPRDKVSIINVAFANEADVAKLDAELIQRGLMVAQVEEEEEEDDEDDWRKRPPTLAEKLRSYFDHCYPDVADVRSHPLWCVGELIEFGGNFNKFVTSLDLTKQEGIVFRHAQRMIMLCGEFERACALDVNVDAGPSNLAWRTELRGSEVLARLGGDEFALVLAGAGVDGADEALERLRAASAIGWSAGVVEWRGDESLDGAMARADAELYRAKGARRACEDVVAWTPAITTTASTTKPFAVA